MRRFRSLLRIGVAAAVSTLGLATAASAQRLPDPPRVLSAGPGDQPDLILPADQSSPFNLMAKGQEGAAGFRTPGQAIWCVQNISIGIRGQTGCPGGSFQFQRNPGGGFSNGYFEANIFVAAGPNDLPSVIDPVESGLRAGGYTVNMGAVIISPAGGKDKMWTSDRTGTELMALGVRSTEDGSCQDFSKDNDGALSGGFQLLPISSCPITHPPSGWQGIRPIEEASFAELFQNDPAFFEDPFAFWRVPADMQRQDKFFGDTQTYGEESDYYFEALPRYGAVVPGQSGAPEFQGWPLGVTIKFDMFNYALPSVGGALYYVATLVNDSEKVYGVGQTYDSLYLGINYDPLMANQASAQYTDISRGTILHNNTGAGCANAKVTPGSTCGTTRANDGFNAGAGALVFLKTPIGDQRYKLFNDPESPFYNPAHPHAGDTITYNHHHICGFGGCAPETFNRGNRSFYGLVTSQGVHALDGRTPGDLSERNYFTVFRTEDWPVRTGEFNKYVPGANDTKPTWDYNHDGVPDTIYADPCGRNGCVANWSDTLPGGFVNNYGNISFMSIGPFRMEPNDTVPLIMAWVGAPDSASIEATVNNTIEFYQRFFLGPEPAPAPSIVARNVVGGSENEAEITLFFDDRSEASVDPFLSTLNVGAELGLNPDLQTQIDERATNNVAAYHIFRSCDGGASYTSDGDCDGDPINDPTSKWSGFGWEPYVTIEADDDGELPNTFTDTNIFSGITYTYVVVTETRGAVFNVVRGGEGNFTAETVEFAPSLLSALSASSTNPNVAVVYVPVNLAAGASNAAVSITGRTGFSTVPFLIDVVSTAPEGGNFRGVFVDSLVVTETEILTDGVVSSRTTTVEGYLVRTITGSGGGAERAVIQTLTFTTSAEVPLSGLTTAAPTTADGTRTTVSRGSAGMVLLNAQDQPLLATTTLTGDDTTPGSFIGSEAFPFFTVAVNRSLGGTFNAQFFFAEEGDSIDARVAPSVTWLTGANQSAALPRSQFGAFELTWADDAYGDDAPFRILDRANLQATFNTSVTERGTGSMSSTDPALLEAIRAVAPSVPADLELVAYDLPFSVKNLVFGGRDVQVVVTGHQETVLLGQGNDTLRVDVPDGVWVPGDTMYFVETVTREVLDASGRTVLAENGWPESETVTAATFRVVLGCGSPRTSCDPTVGGATTSGYTASESGTKQIVHYHTPIAGGDAVAFSITPAVTTEDVVAGGAAADLSNVHVVPNPYIFASQYERSTGDRVLKFTNLPPEGRLRIYDVAGRFIQQIDYTAAELMGGDLNWNMRTREDLELAYGLYVYVLEADGQQKIGKFVVIR